MGGRRWNWSRRNSATLAGHAADHPSRQAIISLTLGIYPAFDATDKAVSETMETMWAQFAKTGNPNPPGTNAWPLYTVAADRFIVFGDTVSSGVHHRRRRRRCKLVGYRIVELRTAETGGAIIAAGDQHFAVGQLVCTPKTQPSLR